MADGVGVIVPVGVGAMHAPVLSHVVAHAAVQQLPPHTFDAQRALFEHAAPGASGTAHTFKLHVVAQLAGLVVEQTYGVSVAK